MRSLRRGLGQHGFSDYRSFRYMPRICIDMYRTCFAKRWQKKGSPNLLSGNGRDDRVLVCSCGRVVGDKEYGALWDKKDNIGRSSHIHSFFIGVCRDSAQIMNKSGTVLGWNLAIRVSWGEESYSLVHLSQTDVVVDVGFG